MTIRRGMSGDTVRRIQELLSSLKLYLGPLDSSFGGGVESAVKNYQSQQHITPTGLVDTATWSQMFPGQPTPVSELANKSLPDRCLALTGSFETGRYPPDCFWGLTGDFDGMGISFGALQWNIGQGTLQPLLKQMFEQHGDVAQSIFHEHFDTVKSLGVAPLLDQLAFTRSIQSNGQMHEPWQGMLFTLGRTPEYQGIQTSHALNLYQQALQLCGEYGLISERAVALMFDIVTQSGSIGSVVKAQILADFSHLPSNDPGNEVAKMRIVANRRAEASRPQFIDDVRTRKLTIANGVGTVHGIVYDLEDMFCLTADPFAKAAAAAI
jgi:Putative peptidoglycan binding domain